MISEAFETEDVRLLTDIGFIALSRGLDTHATAIFEGVRALRPRQEAGPLGLALVHMFRGELDQAVAGLRALPPSDAALTFLGIALSRQGAQAEARDILADVIATAPDTPFAVLAREALG
ncbi:hypothetical protein G3545_18995 [Starkeya sp. ORNL1]|uniref:tetratricopeptide repeat protein n=1 Tax=Starkeya sp. ORNL1 TaxID=2709380 RepID=UPI001462EDFE|nr:hypothetical protein [Starkeya sp. ORNL1]QJP15559.1 hypothetical protein G3545_18995 [Starkeya sp. ORNL1]